MTVFGISMVKDEEDILPYTLPRMAAQLDGVIVADNMSNYATREILDQVALEMGNITIWADDDPAYTQSVKMTALAGLAADAGAEWVVPFDADEVWLAPDASLKDYLSGLEDNVVVVEAALYDHVVTGIDNADEPDPVIRIAHHRDYAGALPKVAVRILPGLVIEMGNHGAHYPGPVHRCGSDMQIRHYPYRSVEQMARKAKNGAAAYAAAGDKVPPDAGRHWIEYNQFLETGGIDTIREIFTTWFYVADPATDEALVLDACPVPWPL